MLGVVTEDHCVWTRREHFHNMRTSIYSGGLVWRTADGAVVYCCYSAFPHSKSRCGPKAGMIRMGRRYNAGQR